MSRPSELDAFRRETVRRKKLFQRIWLLIGAIYLVQLVTIVRELT